MPQKPIKHLPSTYYDSTSKVNPVLAAFHQEFEEFKKFAVKRAEEKERDALPAEDVYARGYNNVHNKLHTTTRTDHRLTNNFLLY